MHPYNSAKRDVAAKIAKYKFDQGLEPRKGLCGRIRYWNDLVTMPMDDPLMYPKFTGTIQSKISTNQHSHLKVSGQQLLMQNTRQL